MFWKLLPYGCLLTLLCFFMPGDSVGSWGTGCAAGRATMRGPLYWWNRIDGHYDDDPQWSALFCNGHQVGAYSHRTGRYYPRLGPGRFGEPCAPPFPTPERRRRRPHHPKPKPKPAEARAGKCQCAVKGCKHGKCDCQKSPASGCSACRTVKKPQEPQGLFGVEADKLREGPAYSRQGVSISRTEALALVDAKVLPDDSVWPRLTLIGTADERKHALDSLQLSADTLKTLALQEYEPTEWAVSRYGFKTDGHPSLYVQKPDGEVVLRMDGPKINGATVAGAIRRAHPNYDPTKDPDGGLVVKWSGLKDVPLPAYLLGGVAGLAFFLRRREIL